MQAPSLIVDPHLGAIHISDKPVRLWPVLSAGCLGLAAVGLLAAAAPRLINNPPQLPAPSSFVQRTSQPVQTSELASSLTAEALLRAAPRLQTAAMQVPPDEAIPASLAGGAAATSPAPSPGLVGLNTASFAELRRLPHIGKSQARTIISGRPYTSVADLAERKILSARAYKAVMGRLELR
jgi:DNA uptake protein ComE-like DNA-binding protein